MIRAVVVAGALLIGLGAVMAQQDVAVKQDNLMRAQGKQLYSVILKTVKGEIPYDQKSIDAALTQLEEDVSTIPTVFATNP
ncbi:MAG TPA: cytochrome C555, partial [Bradyrhizobium sp.]|nr:cytochrome C555 [Bradyrhizobium sp.]